MALKTTSIRGTRDILPSDSHKWRYVERVTLEVAESFGFKELRVPTIEKTELFVKSVGETTDVVQKEMYTFEKGRESITLRPEGTAGAVRAVIENGLLNEALPQKLSYNVSCFRHENPQAGRLREFHQFGVECFGAASPTADAEVIGVAVGILKALGISNVSLEINSIGCPVCRPEYNKKLLEFYNARHDELCGLCKQRLERNPLRLLDCKEEKCAALARTAPKMPDCLCDDCQSHFDGLKERLDALGIEYIFNPSIVRGLDYYTKTVFELVSKGIGAQSAVCGGGRYDLLVEQTGGPETPAIGFAMGIERLIMVMEAEGCGFPDDKSCDLYIGSMGEKENIKALSLAAKLRDEGFYILCDTMSRSVKAQMRYANNMNAAFSCILGENELEAGSVKLKNMKTGESQSVNLTAEAIKALLLSDNR